jgi:hypothetical protein
MAVEEANPASELERIQAFIERADNAGEVESYEQFLEIYDPELAVALSGFIAQNGKPQRSRPDVVSLANRRGLTTITGSIHERDPTKDTTTDVLIEETDRKLAFKRLDAWSNLSIERGMSGTSAYERASGNYAPHTVRDDYIDSLRSKHGKEVGLRNFTLQTGDETAEDLLRDRPQVLNGFLRITSRLVNGLINH